MKFIGLQKYLSILLATFFVAAGCSENTGAQHGGQRPAPLVEVAAVERTNVPYATTYVARTEGSKAVEVRPQVSGILKKKNYVEGQFVKEGDILFTIEPDSYEAALTQAKGSVDQANAKLKEAKLNYERISNLYKQNAISKKDFDTAQATYDSAKAQYDSAKAVLDTAKINLGYTVVIAPVSGYTSKANFSEGNLISVSGTTPLTVINQVDPLYVNFSVPASVMSFIRTLAANKKLTSEELTVTVKMEDGTDYGTVGKVTFLDKQINPTTSDIKVRAEMSNPNMILLPGQFITATLHGFTLVDAVIIPQKSVMRMGDKSMVIVVDENNTAHYKEVAITANLGNELLVETGLNGGERIVVEGSNKVINGSPVRIMSAQPAADTK